MIVKKILICANISTNSEVQLLPNPTNDIKAKQKVNIDLVSHLSLLIFYLFQKLELSILLTLGSNTLHMMRLSIFSRENNALNSQITCGDLFFLNDLLTSHSVLKSDI